MFREEFFKTIIKIAFGNATCPTVKSSRKIEQVEIASDGHR